MYLHEVMYDTSGDGSGGNGRTPVATTVTGQQRRHARAGAVGWGLVGRGDSSVLAIRIFWIMHQVVRVSHQPFARIYTYACHAIGACVYFICMH